MVKQLIIIGCALLASACASTYRPPAIYAEVEVVNNSSETLREVSVRLTGIERNFDCGDIVPFGNCWNRFGKRRYDYEPIQVEWAFGDGARQSEEFVIEVPATYSTGRAMRVMLAVSPEGEMTAYFKQYSGF